MSLFSDLYNTLAKFFRTTEEQSDASKSVATNRLKLVLMQDRTNLTPRILEQMRSELIELLSRYVELDKELLDLNFEQEGEQVALMLSIPVIRAKDEEEIDAAIKEREEMLKAAAQNASENSDETEESGEEKESSELEESIEEVDTRTEEEKAEAEKNDAIAQELTEVPKMIKKKEKKEVSAPEEMTGASANIFKAESEDTENVVESSTEG